MTSSTRDNSISDCIGRIARGKHGAQHLSQHEARQSFHSLMQPDANPLQLGAFLIAMRMKGETSEELAGLTEAARLATPDFGRYSAPNGTVDLPCYAGKRRGAHLYLAAAFSARDAGIPVFVHGVADIPGRITAIQLLRQQGLAQAANLNEASRMLEQEGIAYMELKDLSPGLSSVYRLRQQLGVRSFANTLARLLNPMQCQGQLNGVFHTPYVQHMAQANRLLRQPRSLIFMGTEGEPEIYATRQKAAVTQCDKKIQNVRWSDTIMDSYPRHTLDRTKELFEDFERLLNKQFTPYEEQAAARMKQAFLWAAFRSQTAVLEETQ